MDRAEVRTLLTGVAAGEVAVADAVELLATGPLAGGTGANGANGGTGFADLGFARLDTHRALRTGDPEVVYAAGKTPEQTVALLRAARDRPGVRPAVATRASAATLAAITAAFPDAQIDAVAGAAAVGELPTERGTVCVVAAGTSNAVRAELDAADCLVVIAGMEGALPSVVGGLTGVPLVAVPTSVGYGTSYGGLAALLAMLNSCAPGVVVCNIDNGFGAGVFAARVARRAGCRAEAAR